RADRHLVDLLLEDLPIAGVGVAEGVDADAGGQVQIPVPVDVLDHRALGPGDGQAGEAGDRLDAGGEVASLLRDQGPTPRPGYLGHDPGSLQQPRFSLRQALSRAVILGRRRKARHYTWAARSPHFAMIRAYICAVPAATGPAETRALIALGTRPTTTPEGK